MGSRVRRRAFVPPAVLPIPQWSSLRKSLHLHIFVRRVSAADHPWSPIVACSQATRTTLMGRTLSRRSSIGRACTQDLWHALHLPYQLQCSVTVRKSFRPDLGAVVGGPSSPIHTIESVRSNNYAGPRIVALLRVEGTKC